MLAAHPTHALPSAATASGGGHVSGAHDAADVGAADETGAKPLGHVNAPTRHDACSASGDEPAGHDEHVADAVFAYVASGHRAHALADVARVALLAVPAAHAVHVAAPAESLNVPGGQSPQSAALAPPIFARAVPAAQKLSQKLAPVAAVHEPGGQRRHAARPATGVYEPAAHGSGDVPPGHAEPAGHVAHEKDAPAKEPVPGGHGVHGPVVAPSGENVPLLQCDGGVAPTRHDACAASGKEPTGHVLHDAEPAGAYLDGAHGTHDDSDVERVALLAVPAAHCVQVDEPSESLNVPGGQSAQSDSPVW